MACSLSTVCAGSLLLACESPTAPKIGVPGVAEAVTGLAASALDPYGRFVLSRPVASSEVPIISPEQAAVLAEAYVRTYVINPNVILLPGAESIRSVLEEVHGSPIDWNSLSLDPRLAYFAESPHDPFPDSLPGYVIRAFGPQYLVPLYSNARQAVSISVAAHATNVWIDGNGYVRKPSPSGGEFVPQGVPAGVQSNTPPWPEEAVLAVFRATGARTRLVPTLIRPAERWVPQGARWRLELDRDIVVERANDAALLSTATIYIGAWSGPTEDGTTRYGLQWYLPQAEQPRQDNIPYSHRDSTGEPSTVRIYVAPIREDVPVIFDFVFPRR